MKQRILYLDALKGIAIFLVVLGHVIAWQYPQANFAEDNKRFLLWNIIYAFHMPLFMFCSGLFHTKLSPDSNIKAVGLKILNRFKCLMIPYFVCGSIYWLFSGRDIFYWYLLIVFEFYCITLCCTHISRKFSGKKDIVEVVFLITTYFILYALSRYFLKYQYLPLMDLGHLNLFIYYALGYLISKHNYLDKLMNSNNTISACFIVALCLFYIKLNWGYELPLNTSTVIIAIGFMLQVVCVSKKYFNKKNSLTTKYASFLGKNSIAIYIVHLFFPLNANITELFSNIYKSGG